MYTLSYCELLISLSHPANHDHTLQTSIFAVVQDGNRMHLSCVSELYNSYAGCDQVNIKMPDDLSDCSEDVYLKVFIQQVGRRVDDECNVGRLTTLLRCVHIFNKVDRMKKNIYNDIKQ